MNYKFLVTGDIHLGRRTVHPSEEITDPDLSVSRSWQKLVDLAIEHEVEALLLTGDVIDKENAWFEALHRLSTGLEKLNEHRIRVYAVAGNHDALVLPQLSEMRDRLENFNLLGRGQYWEVVRHICRDGREIEIAGWSFDKEHTKVNPMAELNQEPSTSPALALLHTDLDGPSDSYYAPTTSRDLADSGWPVWLLGHIHKPEQRQTQSPLILYPGSPHALHANETGSHGPWLLQVNTEGVISTDQIPLSPIRYDEIEISLDGLQDADDWRSRFLTRVEEQAGHGNHSVNYRVIDLVCTGDPDLFETIEKHFQEDSEREISRSPSLYIHRLINRTGLPPADLDHLAGKKDLIGILATLLKDFDHPENNESLRELIQQTRLLKEKVMRYETFKPVLDVTDEETAGPVDAEEKIEELLREAVNEWLTELRKQEIESQK